MRGNDNRECESACTVLVHQRGAMEREETRGAAVVAGPRASDGGVSSAKGAKLPLLLTARPGNVGVQIDAFRTMKMFHRPRCGKFTAQFQGINYENHSMGNYARVVERSHTRARIVAERLEKLQQHEAKLIADEQRRLQRRRERETARQRRHWLMRQAAKKAEQREREERAALSIQRVARGSMARRYVQMVKETKLRHSAAMRLQQSMRTFLCRRQSARLHHERNSERRVHAAKKIQRHTRKRQARSRHFNVFETGPPTEPVIETQNEAVETTTSLPLCDTGGCAVVSNAEEEEADDRALLLELVVSTPSPDALSLTGFATPTPPPRHATHSATHPRRPVTIKRVGGGFRQSASFQSPRLRTSRPPELKEMITPRPPPRVARSVHCNAAVHGKRVIAEPSGPSDFGDGHSALHGVDPDENALLDFVEQLDGLVLVADAPVEPLELFLESGTPPGT
jgi:hypothetical protein